MKEKGLEIKSMHIKYVFTEDEKKDSALEMASLISEKEATEDQKKEIASKFTYEINKLDAKIKVIAQEFRQGYTYKNHDCYEVFDYDTKTIFVHRADTEEQVDVRTMSVVEFQREMFDPREEIKEDSHEKFMKDGQALIDEMDKVIPEDNDPELEKDEELK